MGPPQASERLAFCSFNRASSGCLQVQDALFIFEQRVGRSIEECVNAMITSQSNSVAVQLRAVAPATAACDTLKGAGESVLLERTAHADTEALRHLNSIGSLDRVDELSTCLAERIPSRIATLSVLVSSDL